MGHCTPCCCHADHDALKADQSLWQSLPYVGVQRFEDVSPPEVFELRNCPGGSTLAVEVEP